MEGFTKEELDSLAHIYRSSSRPNPRPQGRTTVTPAFGVLVFSKVARLLGSDELVIRQKAVTAAVEMMATAEALAQCLAAGMVPALTKLIDDEDVYVRQQTAMALRNAAVSQQGCVMMKEAGAIAGLLRMLLDDRDEFVRGHSYDAMYEAISSPIVREEVVSTPDVLRRLIIKSEIEPIPGCQLALEIVCRCLGGPTEAMSLESLLNGNAMPFALRLLSHANPGMREHISRLLCRLCVPSEGKTEAVDTGLVPPLVALLEDKIPRVQAAAASALMSITVHNAGKEAFVDALGVPAIIQLLDPNDEVLCFHILQIMVNVAEDPTAKQALMCTLPGLEQILHKWPSTLLKRYAAQAIQQIKFSSLPFVPLEGIQVTEMRDLRESLSRKSLVPLENIQVTDMREFRESLSRKSMTVSPPPPVDVPEKMEERLQGDMEADVGPS